jgi:23S rRNA (uracil1939-C5)-methyltransferase
VSQDDVVKQTLETVTLALTGMANGGAALGRDQKGRVIFVPYAIPGETVRAEIVEDKGRFAQARLLEVISANPQRIQPRCAHFGTCGGCAFQHIQYEAQLAYKREVVRDQLQRIGRLNAANVCPVLPHPQPWAYRIDMTFSPTADNRLGLWSPSAGAVIPIHECHIAQPALMALFADIDLELPGMRSLTLRQGDDTSLLLALAVDSVEPPQLDTDIPVSVAMVLPDGEAANLIGDNFLVQRVRGVDFRVSAGCFFYPSPPMTAQLVEVVQDYAKLAGYEQVVDAYAGVGLFSAFLAPHAGAVSGIELNPDAIDDAAVNLAETENVSLFHGSVEEVLPHLSPAPEVMIVDPPANGLSQAAMAAIVASGPERLIYVSEDIATLARDSRQLAQQGYTLVEVQPLDMFPQSFAVLTVSLWEKA